MRRVSIGLPVFNGELYLAASIDSVLAQTFEDFELILCDNASTDRTVEICADYARRDPRVQVHGSEINRGASWNFNRTVSLAAGEYFQWLSHDDLLAPRFVEACVAALDADPSVVVGHSRVRVIDDAGQVVGDTGEALHRAESDFPHERYRDMVLMDRWCYEVFGLMRTRVLRQTPLLAPHIASDRSLLAELGLRGRFKQVDEYLFLSRDHSGRSVRAMPAHHLRGAWFDSQARGRVFPHLRILGEYYRCVGRALPSRSQRLRCYGHLARWCLSHLNWARMAADLLIAVQPGCWTVLARWSMSGDRWLERSRLKSSCDVD